MHSIKTRTTIITFLKIVSLKALNFEKLTRSSQSMNVMTTHLFNASPPSFSKVIKDENKKIRKEIAVNVSKNRREKTGHCRFIKVNTKIQNRFSY